MLTLPAVVVQALKQYRATQDGERVAAGDKWEETGLVFTTSAGIWNPATSTPPSAASSLALAFGRSAFTTYGIPARPCSSGGVSLLGS